VPLFDLKFLERACGRWCRNFRSAALAVESVGCERSDPGTAAQRATVFREAADRVPHRRGTATLCLRPSDHDPVAAAEPRL